MNAHFEAEYELSELGILVGSYEPPAGNERVEVMPVVTTRPSPERQRAVRAALRRRRGARTPEALLAAVVARQSGPHAKHRVR